MADMFKEQKTYEIVDDQRTKRAAKEEEQKMQKVLDEIGTNSFLKNHKKQLRQLSCEYAERCLMFCYDRGTNLQ